jgi:hypothetical protein
MTMTERGQLALFGLGSVDLNALVSDADPAKAFVTLIEATKITDAGLIIAVGDDSRDRSRAYYLLTPTGVSSAAAPPPTPSSLDNGSGGGAMDLLSLLLLILGLSAFARSQRASPFD